MFFLFILYRPTRKTPINIEKLNKDLTVPTRKPLKELKELENKSIFGVSGSGGKMRQ